MLVGTNQAQVSSHMATALHWAEDRGDEGTHGVEQRRETWAR